MWYAPRFVMERLCSARSSVLIGSKKQAEEAIEKDEHKHFLKSEQEIRNYFLALNRREEKLKRKDRSQRTDAAG